MTRGSDSDSSDDEVEGATNGGPSGVSLEAGTSLEAGLNLGANVYPNIGPSRPKKSTNEEWRSKMEKNDRGMQIGKPSRNYREDRQKCRRFPFTDDIVSVTKPK